MKEFKRSEIFWTSLLALSMIICGIINFQILCIIWIIGSFITFGFMFDEVDSPSLWMFLFPLIWGLTIIAGIIIGLGLLFIECYKLTIDPFNRFLNKNRKERIE